MYFVIWRKSGIFRSDRSKKAGLIRRHRKNETADVTSSGWLASQLFPLPPEKRRWRGCARTSARLLLLNRALAACLQEKQQKGRRKKTAPCSKEKLQTSTVIDKYSTNIPEIKINLY